MSELLSCELHKESFTKACATCVYEAGINLSKELAKDRDAYADRLTKLQRTVVLVHDALSGVRLVSSDQNPQGWRDALGAAASDARKMLHPTKPWGLYGPIAQLKPGEIRCDAGDFDC
jgi:hypothetical protein